MIRSILVALAALFMCFGDAQGQSAIPQTVSLYKNAWTPASPTNSGTTWAAYSNAFTATTYWLNWRPMPTLAKAIAQFVMLAPSAGGYQATGLAVCGVGLTDVTFSNCKLLTFGSWNSSGPAPTSAWVWNPTTSTYDAVPYDSSKPTFGCHGDGGTDPSPPPPHPCWVDITQAIQPYLNYPTPVYLTIATAGNGSAGPLVYEMTVDFAWQLP